MSRVIDRPNFQERLAAAFGTPAGERLLRQIEEERDRLAAAAAARAQLSDELVSINKTFEEALPHLRERAAKTEAELTTAQAAYDKALAARNEATHELYTTTRHRSSRAEIIRNRLAATCDPRIGDAIDSLSRTLGTFHWQVAPRLIRSSSGHAIVDPDPRDSNFAWMKREGVKYRVRTGGSNLDAIEALRQQMQDALQKLRELSLEVEIPADIERRISELLAVGGINEPPSVKVWVEDVPLPKKVEGPSFGVFPPAAPAARPKVRSVGNDA